jgi:hypothetical protein
MEAPIIWTGIKRPRPGESEDEVEEFAGFIPLLPELSPPGSPTPVSSYSPPPATPIPRPRTRVRKTPSSCSSKRRTPKKKQPEIPIVTPTWRMRSAGPRGDTEVSEYEDSIFGPHLETSTSSGILKTRQVNKEENGVVALTFHHRNTEAPYDPRISDRTALLDACRVSCSPICFSFTPISDDPFPDTTIYLAMGASYEGRARGLGQGSAAQYELRDVL